MKVVGGAELTGDNKIKRFYALPIDDYSGKKLVTISKKGIDIRVKVQTDGSIAYNWIKNMIPNRPRA